MFGSFSFVPAPTLWNKEAIAIDKAWTRARITTVVIPQLAGRKVQMHKLAADDLIVLFEAWDKAGLMDRVVTFNGGWVPRYKRGKAGGTDKDLSNHSWGTAFDINAKTNRLGKIPAQMGSPGCLLELVPIAKALGWAWGGDWKKPDGMHFERAAP